MWLSCIGRYGEMAHDQFRWCVDDDRLNVKWRYYIAYLEFYLILHGLDFKYRRTSTLGYVMGLGGEDSFGIGCPERICIGLL